MDRANRNSSKKQGHFTLRHKDAAVSSFHTSSKQSLKPLNIQSPKGETDIQALRQKLNEKKALFYSSTLDEEAEKALFQEVEDLDEQINKLEWEAMSPEEREKAKRISERMQRKFESSGLPVPVETQQEKSSE